MKKVRTSSAPTRPPLIKQEFFFFSFVHFGGNFEEIWSSKWCAPLPTGNPRSAPGLVHLINATLVRLWHSIDLHDAFHFLFSPHEKDEIIKWHSYQTELHFKVENQRAKRDNTIKDKWGLSPERSTRLNSRGARTVYLRGRYSSSCTLKKHQKIRTIAIF